MVAIQDFIFVKQKTAYVIGTGDWSSDVCLPISCVCEREGERVCVVVRVVLCVVVFCFQGEIGRASCRESV